MTKPPSPQALAALSLVAAFNKMDIETISSHRHPDCKRHIRPSSLGLPAQDNQAYIQSLRALAGVFQNFNLAIEEMIEEQRREEGSGSADGKGEGGGRVVLVLKARADTVAGEYVNEYIWILEFEPLPHKLEGEGAGGDDVVSGLEREAGHTREVTGEEEEEKQKARLPRIVRQVEFVDAVMARDFFPKLRTAMVEQQAAKARE